MKIAPLVVVALAACGGGGEGKHVNLPIDAPVTPDSPAAATCLLEPTMGTITPTRQLAYSRKEMDEPAPSNYYLYANLNQDAAPDLLVIDLYQNYGAFKMGWPTGPKTIPLTGEEAQFSSCGACIVAATDVSQAGPTGDPYLATGGTLELTSVGPNKMSGKVTNLQLTHVTIDMQSGVSTPHTDGCKSTLGELAFDAVPMPEMMMANGEQPTRLRLQLKRPTTATLE
jgi:hypothetical protein